jgi:Uma2 family endonuclease
MATTTKTRLTVDDLAAMPDGKRYELKNGELVELSMSPESGYVAGKIYRKLDEFCDTFPAAVVFASGVGFMIRPDDTGLLRKPDAAVVLKSRLSDGRVPSKRFEFAPDLAVEVRSPTDIGDEVEEKIQEYLDAGSAAVWLAKPFSRRIVVYLPDGSETSYGPADDLPGDPVLPGFRLRVGDVFPPPAPR